MEVYILDSLYRRSIVIDRFESLIWTERWADIGDFELLIASNPVNRSAFTADTCLAHNLSKRVMVVETIEDDTDTDGRTRLKVKGRSLEKILEDRTARYSTLNTTLEPKWVITGLAKASAEYMFKHICLDGALDPADIIPLYAPGSAYPAENIPEPTDEVIWSQEPDTLINALQAICGVYDLGFRLYRNDDAGQLYFNVYTGNDRTTEQTVLPPVVFSPGLETVQNTTRLLTIEKAKNVAYVVSEEGFEVVYADDVDLTNLPAGFDRRVLTVKANKLSLTNPDGTPVDPTPTEISNYLIQQGKNGLADNRSLLAFDGEINQHSPYRYGVDYELGDIVEMRDQDGMGNDMRVTEQIFVHDGEGERSYPTLTVKSFVVPGVWNSWLGNREYSDFGVTEYWNTQP